MKEAIDRLATQTILLNSLLSFTRYFFKHLNDRKFICNWHHEVICEYLEAVYNGEIQNLIINVPPGGSKSLLVVDMFSAWSFAKNEILQIPHPKFIHTSYSDDLVNRNSTNVKNIIKHPSYQSLFPVTITKDATTEWYTQRNQGGFYAVASGGQITGFHAGRKIDKGFYGCLVIDDPLKPEDARSDIERNKINTRFVETVRSRLSYPDRTPIVLIMQRLHQQDLTGFLLEGKSGLDFEHLCLPIYEENRKNKYLWTAMWSPETVESLKVDPYVFAGQYQQNPVPEGGGLIRTGELQRYSLPPEFEYKIMWVDPSLGEKQKNDPTACTVWGKYLNRVYLIDTLKLKTDDPATRIKDFFIKHRPRAIYVETNSIGASVVRDLKKYDKDNNISIPVIGVFQHKDKYTNAQNIVPYIKSGYVYVPEQAEWINDLFLELEAFPNGEHDDFVDNFSGGISVMLSDAGQTVYPEFKQNIHVKEVEYLPHRPLILVFNTEGNPAYIACQFTDYGQLRILDSYVAETESRDNFIIKVRDYIQYKETKLIKLYSHNNPKSKTDINDWNYTFLDEFKDIPESWNIPNLTDVIDLGSRLLTENAVNPQYNQEPKVIIDPRAQQLIKMFDGGLVREQEKHDLTQKLEIRKDYPYYNLHNAWAQLVYNTFIAKQTEQYKKPVHNFK